MKACGVSGSENKEESIVINKTPFSQQVAYLGKGMLDAELTEELSELIKAVRDTGRTGSLTLKLNVKMHSARDENTVIITPSVSKVKPKLDLAPSIMFSTADGDLLRNDPDQPELELKTVEAPSKPLKSVAL